MPKVMPANRPALTLGCCQNARRCASRMKAKFSSVVVLGAASAVGAGCAVSAAVVAMGLATAMATVMQAPLVTKKGAVNTDHQRIIAEARNMAREAAKVTMLQRSPTYVVSLPAKDPIATFLHAAGACR